MTVDEVVDALRPWLDRHQRPAWRPRIAARAARRTRKSAFGGLPFLRPREPWPRCGNCELPMQLFLQLELSELPPAVRGCYGTGLLQLFYCTRADCEQYAWDPFGPGNLTRIIDPVGLRLRGRAPLDLDPLACRVIAGWDEVVDLPHAAEHEALGLHYEYDFKKQKVVVHCADLGRRFGPLGLDQTDAEGREVAEAIGRCLTGDKLAGWPDWIQGADYPECPKCGRRMEFVFQVDSEDNLAYMFGDAGCGHIMQCPTHRDRLGLRWDCS